MHAADTVVHNPDVAPGRDCLRRQPPGDLRAEPVVAQEHVAHARHEDADCVPREFRGGKPGGSCAGPVAEVTSA